VLVAWNHGLICFGSTNFALLLSFFGVAVLHVNPDSVDPGLAAALATVCWVDVCFDLSWLVLLFLQAKVNNWSIGLVCENWTLPTEELSYTSRSESRILIMPFLCGKAKVTEYTVVLHGKIY
jgi:hypothetical protein